MRITHSIIKVSNLTISRRWYSSFLFEDTYEQGEGWCSWKSGVTIVSEEKWNEFFSVVADNQNTISLVFEVDSFDLFLRILSLRDDRKNIVAGEGSINGRRYIKLLDPDMNIIVVKERSFDYGTVTDTKKEIFEEKDKISSINLFDKKM